MLRATAKAKDQKLDMAGEDFDKFGGLKLPCHE